MSEELLFLLAADAVLLLHALFVAFVLLGQLLIIVGGWRRWRWVRNRRFRLLHLLAIGIVVIQSWLGRICPLTTWEMALRSRAGDSVYTGSFVVHWVETILYYSLPAWVFVVCYTAFAALVVASWFAVPPRPGSGKAPVNGAGQQG